MRTAAIYYNETPAGLLIETNEGEYTFQYNEEYIKNHSKQFITDLHRKENKEKKQP